MAWLKGTDRLSRADKRLVEDIVSTDLSLQVGVNPPRYMAFQAVVVNQQQLRQRGSVANDRLTDQIRFRVVSTHDEYLQNVAGEGMFLMLAATAGRRKWNSALRIGSTITVASTTRRFLGPKLQLGNESNRDRYC